MRRIFFPKIKDNDHEPDINKSLGKVPNYYTDLRTELFSFIEKGNNTILDVGCGTGVSGEYLKNNGYANEVVGVEVISDVADIARLTLDQVICGDILTVDLPFEEKKFDYIICADVLEHLIDANSVILKLTRYLKDGGYFIVSLPNVRCVTVLFPLLVMGDWKYEKAGILDFTHLRFYTKKSMCRLFREVELKIVEIFPAFYFKFTFKNHFLKAVNLITFKLFQQFLTGQYILKIEKERVSEK